MSYAELVFLDLRLLLCNIIFLGRCFKGVVLKRLPIFFVFDLDEDFIKGHHLELIKNIVDGVIRELRKDPFALESVFISIVTFDGERKIVYPMKELFDFSMPEITPGKGKKFGPCLEALMGEISIQVVKSTAEIKGDWDPICIFFTDSARAHGGEEAIRRWEMEFQHSCVVIFPIGEKADRVIFNRLAHGVLDFESADLSALLSIIGNWNWRGAEDLIFCDESEFS